MTLDDTMSCNSTPKAKRARTIIAETTATIASLPDGTLSHVSVYLSKEARVLFAVAITAPPSSFRKCHWRLPSSLSLEAGRKAILGEDKWDSLDFRDLSISVGRLKDGLKDDDLGAVCLYAAPPHWKGLI